MRRLHLHQTSKTTEAETGVMALRSLGKLAGTVEEQVGALDIGHSQTGDKVVDTVDAHMKSGIGLPLAKMFAEYVGFTSLPKPGC